MKLSTARRRRRLLALIIIEICLFAIYVTSNQTWVKSDKLQCQHPDRSICERVDTTPVSY